MFWISGSIFCASPLSCRHVVCLTCLQWSWTNPKYGRYWWRTAKCIQSGVNGVRVYSAVSCWTFAEVVCGPSLVERLCLPIGTQSVPLPSKLRTTPGRRAASAPDYRWIWRDPSDSIWSSTPLQATSDASQVRTSCAPSTGKWSRVNSENSFFTISKLSSKLLVHVIGVLSFLRGWPFKSSFNGARCLAAFFAKIL